MEDSLEEGQAPPRAVMPRRRRREEKHTYSH
jgi:hypothetical protein